MSEKSLPTTQELSMQASDQAASDVYPEHFEQHWADHYYKLPVEALPFREGMEIDEYYEQAYEHKHQLEDQQGALLELMFSRVEGREAYAGLPPGFRAPLIEPGDRSEEAFRTTEAAYDEAAGRYPIDTSYLQAIGFGKDASKKMLRSNVALAEALFVRLGPENKMARSDVTLTLLAGLAGEEIYQRLHGTSERLHPGEEEPLRSMNILGALADSLVEPDGTIKPIDDPGLAKSAVLVAEILSEAMKAPNEVRSRVDGLRGMSPEEVDHKYYQTVVVTLCDSAMQGLRAIEYTPPEELSNTQRGKQEARSESIQSALLTKYDMLFDTLESGENNPDLARRVLLEFASELDQVIEHFEWGFAYEAFAPLAFRFTALQQGEAGARIWHGTERTDKPKDGFGAGENSYLQKRSSDAQTGSINVSNGLDRAPYGIPLRRFQLKGRTDADEFSQIYDSRVISIHSADAIELLTLLDASLSSDPAFDALSMSEKHKNGLDAAGVSALKQLTQEIERRLDSNERPRSSLVITVGDREIPFDAKRVLDEKILPTYKPLIRS